MTGKDSADGAQGIGCTLKDRFNGVVSVTCGDTAATLYKAMCGTIPYEPSKSACLNGVLTSRIGQSDGASDIVTAPVNDIVCDSLDLFCKNEEFFVKTGLDNGSNKSGFWYEYEDNANGGASKVVWPVKLGNVYDVYAMDSVIIHCKGVCGYVALDAGTMEKAPYAGVAFNIAGINMSTLLPESADAFSWGGLCVTYTADEDMTLQMGMSDDDAASLDYNEPYVTLPRSTNTVETCFSWSSFKQGNGVGETIVGADAAGKLASLRFYIEGEAADGANFNIIRLRKFPAGNYYLIPPAEFVDEKRCGDLWCGPSWDNKVAVSPDVDGGTWWTMTDSLENGGKGTSRIFWPVAPGTTQEATLDSVIRYAGGLAGGVTLGYGYAFPYAKLGFYLDDKTHAEKNIADWEGICLVYKSTLPLAVELVPENENDVTEYNNYKVSVVKSAGVKTINLRWDDFKQERGWGKIIDLETALKKVSAIAISFRGPEGKKGGFTFYSIGKYGTCAE
jgi:hypothetical protein